jgi:hypothetical protein
LRPAITLSTHSLVVVVALAEVQRSFFSIRAMHAAAQTEHSDRLTKSTVINPSFINVALASDYQFSSLIMLFTNSIAVTAECLIEAVIAP